MTFSNKSFLVLQPETNKQTKNHLNLVSREFGLKLRFTVKFIYFECFGNIRNCILCSVHSFLGETASLTEDS